MDERDKVRLAKETSKYKKDWGCEEGTEKKKNNTQKVKYLSVYESVTDKLYLLCI